MAAGGGVEPCIGFGELEPCAVFLLEGEAEEDGSVIPTAGGIGITLRERAGAGLHEE